MGKINTYLRNNILLIFGVLFVGVFLFSTLGKYMESSKVKKETDGQIEKEIEELTQNNDIEDIKEHNEEYNDNVEKSVVDGSELPRTDVYDRLIGVIRNDRVGLKQPIYRGASEVNMRKGVATLNVEDDLDQNLLGISGHRSSIKHQYFSGVPELSEGDFVYIDKYDETGKVGETKYKVTHSYALDPDDRETLDKPTDVKTLRMVTCDVWNPETKLYEKRLITEAVAVE